MLSSTSSHSSFSPFFFSPLKEMLFLPLSLPLHPPSHSRKKMRWRCDDPAARWGLEEREREKIEKKERWRKRVRMWNEMKPRERERRKKTVGTFNTVNVTLWYFLSLVVFSLCVTFPSFKLSRSTHHYWVERGNGIELEREKGEKEGERKRNDTFILTWVPRVSRERERERDLPLSVSSYRHHLSFSLFIFFPFLFPTRLVSLSSFSLLSLSSHLLTFSFSFSLLARITFLSLFLKSSNEWTSSLTQQSF